MCEKENEKERRPRYFEPPDADQQPLGFWRVLLIVLSTHLGVRKRSARADDFKRADGRQLFIAGLVYFALLLFGLILLVNYLASLR